MTGSAAVRSLKGEAGRKGGSVVGSEAKRAASVVKMTAVMRRRLAEEPERVSAISSANGSTACSYIYRCDDCGRIVRGPSIGTHQKRTGHQGRTRVDTTKENA